MEEQEQEVSLTTQRLSVLYKRKSIQLYEQNPDLYVAPNIAMNIYWKGIKAAFLELVEEEKINIHRTYTNIESIWALLRGRYFKNNKKTVNRKY